MLLPVLPRYVLMSLLPEKAEGAEIGVFNGEFSNMLLRNTNPARLHLIDPWMVAGQDELAPAQYSASRMTQQAMDGLHDGVKRRFAKEIKTGRVVVHRAPSAEALGGMADDSLDYVYIDGDHSYTGVLQDLRLAARKVKVGGLVCGNDYVLGKWWKDGVVRAVHDFLRENVAAFTIVLVIGTEFALRRVNVAAVDGKAERRRMRDMREA